VKLTVFEHWPGRANAVMFDGQKIAGGELSVQAAWADTKLQAPTINVQATLKNQGPEKIQAPTSKLQRRSKLQDPRALLHGWFGARMLELGCWMFL